MIVVTGGAGFIGSAVVWGLNERGYTDIVVVDELETGRKWKNLRNLEIADYWGKREFLEAVEERKLDFEPEVTFHLGACSATTEEDAGFLMENNYRYTKKLAEYCQEVGGQFIYASSAATYGSGDQGYSDDHTDLENLRPLNKYAFSKYTFDLHARHKGWIRDIVGLKYFNVFGPNEYHKGDMRSVVHKSYGQARDTGRIKLFKSHRDDFEHGQQKRDFLYVKDAVEMTLFFMDNPDLGGIFNIGAGEARTFDDLAASVFQTMDLPEEVDYIDMPPEIRERYQYHTEANLEKIRGAGYEGEITSLEDGIRDYLENHLMTEDPYLG